MCPWFKTDFIKHKAAAEVKLGKTLLSPPPTTVANANANDHLRVYFRFSCWQSACYHCWLRGFSVWLMGALSYPVLLVCSFYVSLPPPIPPSLPLWWVICASVRPSTDGFMTWWFLALAVMSQAQHMPPPEWCGLSKCRCLNVLYCKLRLKTDPLEYNLFIFRTACDCSVMFQQKQSLL